MRRQHGDALARGEHVGNPPVHRRVVGVHHDLDVTIGQARVEMVVHRPADQRDAERLAHGSTMRTPVIAPSSRKSAPDVNVVGAARYTTAAATSSHDTIRTRGWRRGNAATAAEGSNVSQVSRSTHGLHTVPGDTQLTRMPRPVSSAAIAFVSASTAPFDAPYTARSTRPTEATTEQVLTIAPDPAARIAGRNARLTFA